MILESYLRRRRVEYVMCRLLAKGRLCHSGLGTRDGKEVGSSLWSADVCRGHELFLNPSDGATAQQRTNAR